MPAMLNGYTQTIGSDKIQTDKSRFRFAIVSSLSPINIAFAGSPSMNFWLQINQTDQMFHLEKRHGNAGVS